MRLLIASDIHGSASRAGLFSDKVKELRPDMVLLLGDLLYHGPRNPLPNNYDPAEVVTILSNLSVPVIAVRGNCDAEVDQFVLPWHLADSAWIVDGHHRLLAVHGHHLPEDHRQMKAAPGTAILSGHTHIPTAEKRGGLHWWNPGSLSLPKESFQPSFGCYEDGIFQVLTFGGKILIADSL